MRSHNLFLLFSIIFVLGVSAFFFMESPTGKAIAGFTASVTISNIDIDESNFAQNTTPEISGLLVEIIKNITYGGNGTKLVTVNKPSNFLNGADWRVNESGVLVNVTDLGSTLQWTANLSASSVQLLFTVPPPNITTLIEETSTIAYSQRVLVSAPNPFFDVEAWVAVPSGFTNYRLLLIENVTTDVTVAFNLQINGGVARWSGFDLSNKTFELRADAVSSGGGSRSSGGGGGGFICIDCNFRCWNGAWVAERALCPERLIVDEFSDRIVINPTQVDLSLVNGSIHLLVFRVVNDFAVNKTIFLSVDNPVFVTQVSEITLAPGESRDIEVLVSPTEEYLEGNLLLSGVDFQQRVPLAVQVLPTPVVEQPILESPQPRTYERLWLVLLAFVVLLFYWALKE